LNGIGEKFKKSQTSPKNSRAEGGGRRAEGGGRRAEDGGRRTEEESACRHCRDTRPLFLPVCLAVAIGILAPAGMTRLIEGSGIARGDAGDDDVEEAVHVGFRQTTVARV